MSNRSSRSDNSRHRRLALQLLALLVFGAGAAEPRPLASFEAGTHGWNSRDYDAAGQPALHALTTTDVPGGKALVLPVAFPGRREFVMPLPTGLPDIGQVTLTLEIPENLPADTCMYVFTKDWDSLWRQVRIPLKPVAPGLHTTQLPVTGDPAAARWTGHGHRRPWHTFTPRQVREIGIAFDIEGDSAATFDGRFLLHRVEVQGSAVAWPVPEIRNFGYSPGQPAVLETCEFSFELAADIADPFDRSAVDVSAQIKRPDGECEDIAGFYYEDFRPRDLTRRGGTEILVPSGNPQFRIRYTPRIQGTHSVSITVNVKGTLVSVRPFVLHVKAAERERDGFVRVDADKQTFVYDSGKAFWGIGINVRSPFDSRYMVNVPFSLWQDEGLLMYRRLFETYRRNGINVVEIWMSSWWLALEWINDAPGFHGVGHMNQYRAWMLDEIVRLAEASDIHIILAFNNHGKFGMLHDTEWGRNPFNVSNGGFLVSCEEYFSDARAMKAYERFADYAVARWSASPNILMWKLFTEIDLTGTFYDFYKEPQVAQWHKKAAAYLKSRDPYKHMITTHWMLNYTKINPEIADLPEIDLLTTDAYYGGNQGTAQLLTFIRGGANCGRTHGKPLLVTEFGGSPHADSMGNLIKQAHLGIWAGFFCHSPVAPLFWWFALVDEKNLYWTYRSLSNFSAGEDRRNMLQSAATDAATKISVNRLWSRDRLLVWAFDTDYYYRDEENIDPREVADLTVNASALRDGTYRLELWNCAEGKLAETRTLTLTQDAASRTISVPPFKRDMLLKLIGTAE